MMSSFDVFHAFPIRVGPEQVFDAVTKPELLNIWWPLESSGEPIVGTTYRLYFGPGYDWRARVTKSVYGKEFEWEMIGVTMDDWQGTRVGFTFSKIDEGTQLEFYHKGWSENSAHYRVSSYCWAMYLRLLKRWLEHGEVVPHARRLDV